MVGIMRIRCRYGAILAALLTLPGAVSRADDLAPPPAGFLDATDQTESAAPIPADAALPSAPATTDGDAVAPPAAAVPSTPVSGAAPAALTGPVAAPVAVSAPFPQSSPAADGTASVMVAPPLVPPAAAGGPLAASAADALPGQPLPPAAATPVVEAATAPAQPALAAPSGVADTAPALLAELLTPETAPAAAAAYARPLTLLEALQRSGDPARRLWIVQAYWKTALAFAAVHSCRAAGQRIDLIAPGADPHDRAVLDVAAAASRADTAEAIALLGMAQQELADLARLPPNEPPPWPVDRPLATPYQTHFDALFATRIATGRVRAIARTLPARHEAFDARAAAVRAATEALAMAEADHAKGRRPIEAVVAAHAAVVAQEREFLRAARTYNTDIAEYAMSVADLSVPDQAFVAMLIGATTPPAIMPQQPGSQLAAPPAVFANPAAAPVLGVLP